MKNKISRRKFLASSVKTAVFLGLGQSQSMFQKTSSHKEIDVLIHRGLVFDGSGNSPVETDIAIRGDEFILIEKNINHQKAKRIINAKGLAVSPGFIDAHSHTDVELLVNPKAETQVRQGVTTEISGNCGFSPFPFPEVIFEEQKKNYLI